MTILAILAVVAAAFFGSALSLTVAAFFVVRKAKEYMAPQFSQAAFEAGIPPVAPSGWATQLDEPCSVCGRKPSVGVVGELPQCAECLTVRFSREGR